ncbi:reverse transcriptase domain-containing protein [Tanacetum coccineum]
MTIIGTKWVFRNKLDENSVVSRNKVRLVAQGYNQQEGIDYDKTYAPVHRLESIRILLDYACALDFKKDHFPLPFIDQMLERLSGNEYYCFLDGFSEYFQIPLAPEDQEKTTFTCPYGTFVYRRMPFELCNARATFQRCMTAIFHDMCKEFMEVFMDEFSIFGNSFDSCLTNLSKNVSMV